MLFDFPTCKSLFLQSIVAFCAAHGSNFMHMYAKSKCSPFHYIDMQRTLDHFFLLNLYMYVNPKKCWYLDVLAQYIIDEVSSKMYQLSATTQ